MITEPLPSVAREYNLLPQPETLSTDMLQANLVQWLTDHAWNNAYLLAHAEDGVIWGRFKNGIDEKPTLTTSHDAFPALAELRIATLWEVRIFGPDAEVLLWRDGSSWQAHKLMDAGHDPTLIIKEKQILWGNQAESRNKNFTLLADGYEGLRHGVPIDVPDTAFSSEDNPRPLRLHVRHYVTFDKDGNARIGLSRLYDLTI
jgi:CRISPR-associated protein (TIGR03984 family)